MKKSPITKLLHGECGDEFFKNDGSCDEVLDKLDEYHQYMVKQLEGNDDLFKAYKNMVGALEDLDVLESEMHFKNGFAFGVLLGLEIAGYDK